MKNKNFELLAPAGSFQTLKAVIEAGADAVYVGGELFGARAFANNFTEEELLEAIDYVHLKGCQLYLTINTLLKNEEIGNRLYQYLLPYYKQGLDAVLVQDFGVLNFIHENFPDLPIHTSTQMTVTGVEGVRFLQQYGVTRVVMAREVSLEEMQKIHEETGMELEAFVHGALCYSYSGQCLFSSILGGRSGNRGRCAQPCRLSYSVLDDKKKEYLKDSYVLSLKDMCGIQDLPALMEAGVFSLKIEGRMKQSEYAAGVVSYYRKYIDQLSANPKNYKVSKAHQQDLEDLGNRCGFTDLYYKKHNDKSMVTFVKPNYATDNEALHNQIRKSFVEHQSKLEIQGYLYLHKEEESMLSISFGEYSVSITGAKVSLAVNKPVTEEEVSKRLRKTGDTPFIFTELTIDMESDVFVPNGILNQLRRDALEQLKACILTKYRRQPDAIYSKPASKSDTNPDSLLGDTVHLVAIEERKQLGVALKKDWISGVYIDWNTYFEEGLTENFLVDNRLIKSVNKESFLILPAISREKTMQKLVDLVDYFKTVDFDGFLVKTYEELYYVRRYFSDKKLVIDHNLYTYNDYGVNAFLKAGANFLTIPLELNRKEIIGRDNRSSEMIVYGYYPLMTTAPCVHCNTRGCDHRPTITYLKDRYQKLFPVKNNCKECYNTVYNSLPVMLAPSVEELARVRVSRFRWNFTIETPEEMQGILDSYETSHIQGEFTKGHYKRGVE